MSFSQLSLFDDSAKLPRLFFLTNRYNLLEFLSSGLILPRHGIEKYYSDLLEPAAGHIPLFTDSIPSECVEYVSAESKSAFPVAIEVEASSQALASAQRFAEVGLLVSSRPIPMSSATSVSFRSDLELAEHSARHYSNVPTIGPLLVRPELFEATAPTLTTVLATLSELGTASNHDVPGRVDRAAGLKLTLSSIGSDDRARAPSDLEVDGWLKQPIASSALSAFASLHPANGWPALRILESLEAELRRRHDQQTRSTKAIEMMRGVIRNDQPLDAAIDELDVAALAVLLVLLRPDPVRLRALGDGVPYNTRWRAEALAGWLVGFSRMEKPDGTSDYCFVDEEMRGELAG